MSKAMKFTIIKACSWTLVGLFMVMIFSNPSTILEWGDNKTKTLLLAALFLFGYTADLTLMILEKTKRFGFKRDERDLYIQHKAMSFGYISTLIYVFSTAILLYTLYENKGAVPVGWLWFIAYSLVIVANLSMAVTALILYRKQGY
ncbi:MAG: hypothetical protein JXR88_00210 [Clostridia bacterium]|nr:hypothetical protein [Clostridia bacterium]